MSPGIITWRAEEDALCLSDIAVTCMLYLWPVSRDFIVILNKLSYTHHYIIHAYFLAEFSTSKDQ